MADRADEVTFKREPGMIAWGATPRAYQTVFLGDAAFDLDDRLFASLVLHETVHADQGYARSEAEADQIQSDFMRSVGLSGTVAQLQRQVKGNVYEDGRFLSHQQWSMQHEGVVNPAVR